MSWVCTGGLAGLVCDALAQSLFVAVILMELML